MDARLSHTLAFVGGIVLTVVGLEAGRFGHWLLLSPKGPQVASALSEEAPRATKAERLAQKKNALTKRNLDERLKAGPAKGAAADEAVPEDRETRREKRREAMKGLLEGVDQMDPDERRQVIGERLKAMGADDKMLDRMRTRAKARRERGEGEGKGSRLRDKPGRRGGKAGKAEPGEAEVPAVVDTGTPPEPGSE